MKKINRKILLVISLVLVLSITVGLTMAYFSDHTAAKGGMKVALGSKTEIEEDQPDDHTKTIIINNTGETDVMVRVAVYGPGEISYSGSGWTNGNDGYWYYNSIIPAGESSDALTATWEVPADLGDDYSVVVTQEAEMVVYDAKGKVAAPDTDPAWAVVPAAN